MTAGSPVGPQVRWAVLGTVRAWCDGVELDLGPPQQRAALAVLLLGRGRTVTLGELTDALWGSRPPATAVNVLHRYIGRLRRILEPGLPVRAAGRFVLPGPGGYRLEVPDQDVDLGRFQQITEQARAAAEQGRPHAAVPLFLEALQLWQGPVGAGLDPEVRAHQLFTALEQERIATVQALADAALGAGVAQQALPYLRLAAADHPWAESLQARLILALAAAGEQAEALAHYDRTRAQLSEELGIDPGTELRSAQQQVLRQELPRPPVAVSHPAHLPAALPGFSGRTHELAGATALLGAEGAPPGAMVVATVTGMAGIGKTTFALRWAHQVADRFPDGQLYVNLRGFDPAGELLDPAVVVRSFLSALDVPPGQIPAGVDAQAALLRSLLTDRRMLLLLDNARDEDQVRPLLPGSAGHLVIVTSRSLLSGLVAREGAHPVILDLPTHEESRSALAGRLGQARVDAEPEAVDEIISRCGRLPLALAVVAARALANPTFTLAALAAELRETAGSLDAFADTEPSANARIAFSLSYRALSPDAARLFRLLALRPGPDVGTAAAADLAGTSPRRVRPLLAELARAHLIGERAPGRYVMHDLIGAYATELVEDTETDAERRSAQERIIGHYLYTAYAGNRLIEPHRHSFVMPPAPEDVAPAPLADADAAMAWFAVEYPVLMSTVRQATELGLETSAWQLTWAMQQFFDRRGLWHDWLATLYVARTAAARRSDRVGLAHIYRGIGTAYSRLGRADDSYRELDRALDLFGELDDPVAQANLHLVLGSVKSRSRDRRRLLEARDHSYRALELFTAADSTVGRARAMNNVGYTSALLGDHQAALDYSQASIELHRELGDQHGLASAWDSVGLAQHNLGRSPEAIAAYRTALEMYTALGNRYFLATTYRQLGDAFLLDGSPDQAREAWEQALGILDDLDHPDAGRVREKLNRSVQPAPGG